MGRLEELIDELAFLRAKIEVVKTLRDMGDLDDEAIKKLDYLLFDVYGKRYTELVREVLKILGV